MSFLETPRFPECISQGAQGGPEYSTEIVVVSSGHERRNVRWPHPLNKYDVSFGARSADYIRQLVAFFHIAKGRAYPFRYKDWQDYKSSASMTDQITSDDVEIGVGDGIETEFQLVKKYISGSGEYDRTISKPVSGTVVVAINGATVDQDDYTVDYNTGIITFDTPPGNLLIVTAGFEFDVPVRFDTDSLNLALLTAQIHGAPGVPLIEVRV